MKLKVLSLIMIASFLLASCSKDEEVEEKKPLTVEESKLEVESLMGKGSDDVLSMIESKGIDGARAFLDLAADFDFGEDEDEEIGVIVKQKVREIAQFFAYGPASRFADGKDEGTSFDEIKGLYTWNPTTETFDETESDVFVVKFPTEGSTSNNAELKISELEMFIVIEEDDFFTDEDEYPDIIKGYMKIDGVEVISLDFDADWSDTGELNKADIDFLLAPFSFDMGFDQTVGNTASLSTSMQANDENLMAVDVTVNFLSDEQDEVESVDGFVQYCGLKVAGSADIETLDAESEGEDEDPDLNKVFDLAVSIDEQEIGTVVFKEDIPYVQYTDGSEKMVEELIETAIDDVEDLIDELEEELDDDEDEF